MMLLYDLGYKVFFMLKRLRIRFCFLEKPVRKYEYYFLLLLNRLFIPWLEKNPVKWGLNAKPDEEQYVVSLTSFPVRIHYVHIAIETIMRQSRKPDRIVLWLAESQFPDKKLPGSLTKLEERGLTIRWCDDLRSHKKYFYAFQEYPEANILLVDDDIFYPKDTVKKLIALHKKKPNDIICALAQVMAPTLTSPPSVWSSPELAKRYTSRLDIQAFTGAGSLFPAHWYSEELFDKEKAMALAETVDDLWLKAMSIIADVDTSMVYPLRGFPVQILIENDQYLYFENSSYGNNGNNRAWQALVAEYGIEDYH